MFSEVDVSRQQSFSETGCDEQGAVLISCFPSGQMWLQENISPSSESLAFPFDIPQASSQPYGQIGLAYSPIAQRLLKEVRQNHNHSRSQGTFHGIYKHMWPFNANEHSEVELLKFFFGYTEVLITRPFNRNTPQHFKIFAAFPWIFVVPAGFLPAFGVPKAPPDRVQPPSAQV